ncbi:MAG TPA: hypothetical protein VJV39_18270 [Dongiaceae bacterium]|nr:hypothetical protein [Dongiaceae bacterium]
MSGARTAIWLAVATGLLLFVGANAHLVYVAVTSQPGCVAHLKPGESDPQRASFSAAQSSCSPQPGGAPTE